MSRRAAVSAINLIHGRGFLNKSGILSPPFSLFSSKAFQPKRRRPIDFSTVKELDDAINLFRELKSMRPEPSIRVYNNLMSVCVKIEQYSFAVKVFDEMLQMGFPVNCYTMNIAINCCCHLKDINSGFAIMAFFFKGGYEPDAVTINPLIKGFFLEGKEAESVKLFQKVLDLKLCEPDQVMILHLIDGLCKTGQVIAAYDWVRRLESCGLRPDVWAYSALIDGFCKVGNVDGALPLLPEMTSKGILPNVVTYNALIDGFCLKGEVDKAKQLLDSMVDMDLKPNIVSYSHLLNGYCKKGRVDEARLVFHEISCKGLLHNVFTYNTMIHGLFSANKFGEGWKLVEDMEDQQVCFPDLHTYTILLDVLCSNGEMDKAVSLLRLIEDKGFTPDVVTYGTLINGLCNNGKHGLARYLFNQLQSYGVQPNVQIYTIIIGSFCQEGSFEEVKRLLLEMEDRGCGPNRATYNVIIRSLLKKQYKAHKARSFMEEMRGKGSSTDSATSSVPSGGFVLKFMKDLASKEIVS